MNIFCLECWTPCNTIELVISIVLTLSAYLVIFVLKPKLKIDSVFFDNQDKIKIVVKNLGYTNAINLQIEACNYSNPITYHFMLDHEDFLILPGKQTQDNSKVFKITGASASAIANNKNYQDLIDDLITNQYKLRVRLHSSHGFSGFGKAEQQMFRCDGNTFIKTN